MKIAVVFCTLLLIALPGYTQGIRDLTEADTQSGLKEALVQGASAAVGKLGRTDGFFKNKKVKIPLPESLRNVEGVMGMFGMKKQADEMVVAMNRAAEAAVLEATALLHDAIKQMTLQDAKFILTGGDHSATDYFRKTTQAPLRERFLPIVKEATGKVALTEKYDALAVGASKMGLVDEKDASIEEYVTRKALDGLFLMIAEEEKAIRKDPAKQASSLVRKVFGALGR